MALDPALDVSQYAHTAWKIKDGFPKSRVIAFAQTPDGYLWLAADSGVVRFDGLRSVPWQPPAGQSLPDPRVFDLFAARDGTLWIGTYGGLAAWNGRVLTTYPQFDGYRTWGLLEDREGTVWVAADKPQGPAMV
jgi:ligand-binding sensor domain-containing protein